MSQGVIRIPFFASPSTRMDKKYHSVSSAENSSAGTWLKGLEACQARITWQWQKPLSTGLLGDPIRWRLRERLKPNLAKPPVKEHVIHQRTAASCPEIEQGMMAGFRQRRVTLSTWSKWFPFSSDPNRSKSGQRVKTPWLLRNSHKLVLFRWDSIEL